MTFCNAGRILLVPLRYTEGCESDSHITSSNVTNFLDLL